MKTPVRATLIAGAVVIVVPVVVLILAMTNKPDAPTPAETEGALPGTRVNSHVLDDAGPDAPTLVEFLDFECEVCGAFYPVIEQIREDYDGEINYVIRYFPLPGHHNSMNAALAAEAAAQQGQLEPMYHLFETQSQWGEQQVSLAPLFRDFAQELGLEMKQYDAAIADPATQARVEDDFNDGRLMNVTGTPTFFLDGEKLELSQPADLTDAIDSAIGR